MSKYLDKMSNIQFDFRELGNYIIQLVEGYELTESQIEKALSLLNGDTKRAEYNINRFFFFRDYLDEYYPGEDVEDQDLIDIAYCYRKTLEQSLSARFPNKKFQIEIIGEDLVDVEPLELCVTFSST